MIFCNGMDGKCIIEEEENIIYLLCSLHGHSLKYYIVFLWEHFFVFIQGK